MSVTLVIPAFEPQPALVQLVAALGSAAFSQVVVVNDGSGPGFQPVFDRVRALTAVTVLDHPINLGKGAALKTGMQYVLRGQATDASIVTADADGQHTGVDIVRVAEAAARESDALVLGVRRFGSGVPLRSRVGNALTSAVVRLLTGSAPRDTQTGLRGVPNALARAMLRVPANRYEFELEMLLAAKRYGIPLREVQIETVYLDGNAGSHFNPLTDSARICSVLLRSGWRSVRTGQSSPVNRQ